MNCEYRMWSPWFRLPWHSEFSETNNLVLLISERSIEAPAWWNTQQMSPEWKNKQHFPSVNMQYSLETGNNEQNLSSEQILLPRSSIFFLGREDILHVLKFGILPFKIRFLGFFVKSKYLTMPGSFFSLVTVKVSTYVTSAQAVFLALYWHFIFWPWHQEQLSVIIYTIILL